MLLDPALEPNGPDVHSGIGRLVADRSRESRVFAWFERPQVWVLHNDGRWYPGWLHGWLPAEPRPQWWGIVAYHAGTGLQHYMSLPARFIKRRTDRDGEDQDDAGQDEAEVPCPCE